MRKRVNKSSKITPKIPTALNQVTPSSTEITANVSDVVINKVSELAPQVKKIIPSANKISLLDIIQTAKNENPVAFNKVTAEKALMMTRTVLGTFKQQLKDTHTGNIKLVGLGRFIIKEIQREKNGEKMTRQQILFRVANPKKKAASAASTVNIAEKAASSSNPETTEILNPNLKNEANLEKSSTLAVENATPIAKPTLEKSEQSTEITNAANQNAEQVNKMNKPEKKAVKVVKLVDIIRAAKAEKKQAFGNLNDKKVIAIVRAVLAQANKQIKETEEGNVVLGGLGKFIIRQVEVEKDGQKITRRRVAFRQIVVKKKKAE